MSAADEVAQFAAQLEGRLQDLVTETTGDLHESITTGDPLTGSPGQPIDTGFLINSWTTELPESFVGQVTTNVAYATAIEEGEREAYDPEGVDRPEDFTGIRGDRPAVKSTVGGNHSVKMTRLAWQRIVDRRAAQIAGGDA